MTVAIAIDFVACDPVLITHVFSHLSYGNLIKWRWHFSPYMMNREGKSGAGVGQCVACRRSVPWDLAMGLQ